MRGESRTAAEGRTGQRTAGPGRRKQDTRLAAGVLCTGDVVGDDVAGSDPARDHQVKRGPTNHSASPSANFTSPLRPQLSLNFTSAPTRP